MSICLTSKETNKMIDATELIDNKPVPVDVTTLSLALDENGLNPEVGYPLGCIHLATRRSGVVNEGESESFAVSVLSLTLSIERATIKVSSDMLVFNNASTGITAGGTHPVEEMKSENLNLKYRRHGECRDLTSVQAVARVEKTTGDLSTDIALAISVCREQMQGAILILDKWGRNFGFAPPAI